MFDFRKIEAFCKVCEQRSFSKAGEALFLSQPTVSAHIQSLERDFEVRLLDRMGRTVLPTPAGAVLYRYAKQAFARLETAKAEISALTLEVTGDLIIGSSSIPAHHVLPDVLASFSEMHPKVHPSLMVASSAAILRHVHDGDIMTGIVGSINHHEPDIISTPLLDSEIIIIAPPSLEMQPLAQASSSASALPQISFAFAKTLPWILREESSTTRRLFEEAVHHAGHNVRQLNARLKVDSSHAAVQYVRAGLGVSAAARIAVQEELDRGDIRAFGLEGVFASRQFVCIANTRRMPFPSATVFQEFLLSSTTRLRLQNPLSSLPDASFPE
ncbi:LysR family transcriptional regulator [Desulfovibrio sp. OttesenSCG-928-G15]|nr:LysR family transcriptional regulator [Desulfovibrio sp. OttesenSCG-928-G15]